MKFCVTEGQYAGRPIRRSKSNYLCQFFRRGPHGGRCRQPIWIGEFYVVGYSYSGGGGAERWCLRCVPEAKVAVEAREKLLREKVLRRKKLRKLGVVV